MVKKGYYGNEGLGLAWDFEEHSFSAPNFVWLKNYNLECKGVIEKYLVCFLVYSFS